MYPLKSMPLMRGQSGSTEAQGRKLAAVNNPLLPLKPVNPHSPPHLRALRAGDSQQEPQSHPWDLQKSLWVHNPLEHHLTVPRKHVSRQGTRQGPPKEGWRGFCTHPRAGKEPAPVPSGAQTSALAAPSPGAEKGGTGEREALRQPEQRPSVNAGKQLDPLSSGTYSSVKAERGSGRVGTSPAGASWAGLLGHLLRHLTKGIFSFSTQMSRALMGSHLVLHS